MSPAYVIAEAILKGDQAPATMVQGISFGRSTRTVVGLGRFLLGWDPVGCKLGSQVNCDEQHDEEGCYGNVISAFE